MNEVEKEVLHALYKNGEVTRRDLYDCVGHPETLWAVENLVANAYIEEICYTCGGYTRTAYRLAEDGLKYLKGDNNDE